MRLRNSLLCLEMKLFEVINLFSSLWLPKFYLWQIAASKDSWTSSSNTSSSVALDLPIFSLAARSWRMSCLLVFFLLSASSNSLLAVMRRPCCALGSCLKVLIVLATPAFPLMSTTTYAFLGCPSMSASPWNSSKVLLIAMFSVRIF